MTFVSSGVDFHPQLLDGGRCLEGTLQAAPFRNCDTKGDIFTLSLSKTRLYREDLGEFHLANERPCYAIIANPCAPIRGGGGDVGSAIITQLRDIGRFICSTIGAVAQMIILHRHSSPAF